MKVVGTWAQAMIEYIPMFYCDSSTCITQPGFCGALNRCRVVDEGVCLQSWVLGDCHGSHIFPQRIFRCADPRLVRIREPGKHRTQCRRQRLNVRCIYSDSFPVQRRRRTVSSALPCLRLESFRSPNLPAFPRSCPPFLTAL